MVKSLFIFFATIIVADSVKLDKVKKATIKPETLTNSIKLIEQNLDLNASDKIKLPGYTKSDTSKERSDETELEVTTEGKKSRSADISKKSNSAAEGHSIEDEKNTSNGENFISREASPETKSSRVSKESEHSSKQRNEDISEADDQKHENKENRLARDGKTSDESTSSEPASRERFFSRKSSSSLENSKETGRPSIFDANFLLNARRMLATSPEPVQKFENIPSRIGEVVRAPISAFETVSSKIGYPRYPILSSLQSPLQPLYNQQLYYPAKVPQGLYDRPLLDPYTGIRFPRSTEKDDLDTSQQNAYPLELKPKLSDELHQGGNVPNVYDFGPRNSGYEVQNHQNRVAVENPVYRFYPRV